LASRVLALVAAEAHFFLLLWSFSCFLLLLVLLLFDFLACIRNLMTLRHWLELVHGQKTRSSVVFQVSRAAVNKPTSTTRHLVLDGLRDGISKSYCYASKGSIRVHVEKPNYRAKSRSSYRSPNLQMQARSIANIPVIPSFMPLTYPPSFGALALTRSPFSDIASYRYRHVAVPLMLLSSPSPFYLATVVLFLFIVMLLHLASHPSVLTLTMCS